MTIESWKAEFYPVEAYLVPNDTLALLEHSIKKWEGLLPKNRKKHDLVVGTYGRLTSEDASDYDNVFKASSESCSLCHHYNNSDEPECVKCPLYIVRGNIECDAPTEDEKRESLGSPWGAWAHSSKPERMIMWLKKAKDALNV